MQSISRNKKYFIDSRKAQNPFSKAHQVRTEVYA